MTLGLQGVMPRPRVYYAMGKPLFAINGPRFENSLVELGPVGTVSIVSWSWPEDPA